MTEWLVEHGIGEERAVLAHRGAIAAARLHWPGGLTAGQVADAKLISRHTGLPRGTVRFASGEEALIDRLPPSASEGAIIRVEVTRAAMPENGRRKLAHAQPSDKPLKNALSLVEQLESAGQPVRQVRRFPDALGWNELWQEAWDGHLSFAGGALLWHVTPAMTLIDVDGEADPLTLSRAAIAPLAAALRRFDLGGSIGIDFPTITDKAARKTIDAALGQALADWPHERTAMNGFGFIQLVARAQRPSLLGLLSHDRPGAAARHLLRTAEGLEGPGATLLTCSRPVASALRQEWLQELARRTGRPVRLEIQTDALDLVPGHAQLVPHA